MKLFLRDMFPSILEGIKVPNKVMSGYIDECIMNLIHFTVFKTAVPVIVVEIRDNKAKFVREKCMVSQRHYEPNDMKRDFIIFILLMHLTRII